MHSSSNLTNFFLLTAALLVLHTRAAAGDDGSGFHGYERDALLDLKARLNSSFLDRNWTGIMCYMDNTPYWYGVQCLKGRVTGLVLNSIGLTGEIKADALANLTELQTLSFNNNSIRGSVMDFTDNHKLRSIDLSRNRFSGEIPSSLLNLDSLESLQIQDNAFTGPIPGFTHSRLTRFNVSNNDLSGEIPHTKTLESFGLSSYLGNANLCGPPTPTRCSFDGKQSVSEANSDQSSGEKGHSSGILVAVLVVVDAVVMVIILLLFIMYYKKYKKLRKEMKEKEIPTKDEEHDSRIMQRRIPEGERGKLVFMENNEGTTTFDLDDLLRASAEGLGKGNFGNCYKAMMEVGPAVVVKRLRDLKPLNKDEFVRQITAIADQKHPNLLPLLAYFYSKDEKLFVYKFAANGNLFNRLHGGRGTRERFPFRWSSRLAAARGVARALKYLHGNTRSQTAVPHGNLKSSNVLIDENDEILVADYGLTSLIALPIAAQRMVAYKCPEYLSQKSVSKKSDVWSYGSLLLELLTGRASAHSAAAGTSGVDLCSWVHRAVREEWTAEIFDAEMAVHRGANRGMLRLMQIALRCCDRSPEKRPEMGQVAAEVEEIKAGGESEDEEYSYSSYDRSLTDDSVSVSISASASASAATSV
ncbi:probable inactive receptor kinase At2g26730 [Salvia miltiorrhiza]|uniref:probable inactive receptor kinase At2g26730 n=1 Tax=Salvia miltiorrhiza TaxID=226208 RepID=UPI0025AD6CD1|nr:probable inactive receptor kinase At2g26730 [Salvia miltiorrhiza]